MEPPKQFVLILPKGSFSLLYSKMSIPEWSKSHRPEVWKINNNNCLNQQIYLWSLNCKMYEFRPNKALTFFDRIKMIHLLLVPPLSGEITTNVFSRNCYSCKIVFLKTWWHIFWRLAHVRVMWTLKKNYWCKDIFTKNIKIVLCDKLTLL